MLDQQLLEPEVLLEAGRAVGRGGLVEPARGERHVRLQRRRHVLEHVAIELQNVAFGIEAGFKIQCEKDPAILKALDVMPEAEALLHKKQQTQRGTVAMVGTTL